MTIPARHPERPLAVPALVRLFALVLGLREPTPEQWRRLGEQLTVGDEPMDRLVEWMSTAGMQQARALFERASAEGIANVPEAPEPLREFFGTGPAPVGDERFPWAAGDAHARPGLCAALVSAVADSGQRRPQRRIDGSRCPAAATAKWLPLSKAERYAIIGSIADRGTSTCVAPAASGSSVP